MMPEAATKPSPDLKRSLRLWHLVIYGIIIIQPTAPMPVYGVISNVACGLYHPHRDGCHAVHGNQLRPDGARVSQRRLCILCWDIWWVGPC